MSIGLSMGLGLRGSRPATFRDIPGLAVWLRGDYVTLNSGNVSSWTNRGNLGLASATQGTALKQVPWEATGFAGRPCLHSSGSQHLVLPDLSALTAGHIFAAVQADADPPAQFIDAELWVLGTGADTLYPFTDNVVYETAGTSVRKTLGNPTPSLAAVNIYEIITTATEYTAKFNGTQLFTTGTNVVAFPAAPTICGYTTVGNWKGRFAEFLLFNAKQSTAVANAVRRSLGARYGITVA